MRTCLVHGCSTLTDTTRCTYHTKAKRRREDKRRPNARQRGYDAKWESTRYNYLAAFPICQWHGGCLLCATDVHHIDGKGPKGERGHDWSNLMGLCHAHHSQITSKEQKGGWHE